MAEYESFEVGEKIEIDYNGKKETVIVVDDLGDALSVDWVTMDNLSSISTISKDRVIRRIE